MTTDCNKMSKFQFLKKKRFVADLQTLLFSAKEPEKHTYFFVCFCLISPPLSLYMSLAPSTFSKVFSHVPGNKQYFFSTLGMKVSFILVHAW